MAVGYGITKGGLLSAKARGEFTNLVLYVFLPCSIFTAFQRGLTPETMRLGMIALIVACGLQVLVFILNKFLYFWIPPGKRIILKYTTITNNANFMGFTVLAGIYGEIGILYGSIFIIPMRILMWTSGLSLYTDLETKKRIFILVTHPCMIAVVIGIGAVYAPFELPVFLMDAIRWVGDLTRVLPMIIVGSILSGVKLKEVPDIHCFYYSFFRLIVIPAVMFVALDLLNVDPIVTGVTVLMAAMPAAVVTAALAEKYGQDAAFGSKVIFVSTVLSMVTLPLTAAALTWLL